MKTRRDFLKKTSGGAIAGIIASGAAPAFAQSMKRKKGKVSLEDARKLHDKCLIIDGHNDTPVERVSRGENPMNWMQLDMEYHTDIPRMRDCGQYVAFMIVGNGVTADVWVTTELLLQGTETDPKDIALVRSSKDAVRAGKSGKVGMIISVEGIGRWLDGNVDTLRIMHRLGLRLAGITHGEGGSEPHFLQGTKSLYRICTMAEREDDRKNAGGLTPFGKDVLKASNEMGILTDLSHINDRAFYDVLEQTSKPCIMSHSAVYALCPHARGMTDDQLKALAQNGGAVGIAFAPQFIDVEPKNATIDRFVEHILYVIDLVGIDYVGIGTDYDGLGRVTIPVIPEVSQLVLLTQSMMEHGMSADEIKQVWGGNFLRLIKANMDV